MWQCPGCKRTFQKQNQNHFCKDVPASIMEYITSQPKAVQPVLFTVRSKILECLPEVNEKIAWRMPTFYDKKYIIHFAAFKNHLGIYPGPEAILFFQAQLKPYHYTKGAIQFPFDKEIPYDFIQKIAIWCAKERK